MKKLTMVLKNKALTWLDVILVLGSALAAAIINVILRILLPGLDDILLSAVEVGFFATLLLAVRRREVPASADRNKTHYRQTEAFVTLLHLTKPKLPFPSFRDGAISPDIGAFICGKLITLRPQSVVECGSGVSTLVIGYILKNNGGGKLISLEHDPVWVKRVKGWIHDHGLNDYVTVVNCPLETIKIENQQFKWYAKEKWETYLSSASKVELIFIDGPPGDIQQGARYPALPLLDDFTSSNLAVIVDDADRPDDRAMIEQWTKTFNMSLENLQFEKGGAVLTSKQ